MRRLLFLFLSLLLIGACSSGPTPEELASLAAEGYYRHLLNGEYEQFMAGKDGLDVMPEDYREQMLAAYKQYMAAQQEVHHGVLDVRVSNAKTDSSLQLTNVFLVLCFGDSTNEEIAVPMVEREGRWKMR